MASYFYLILQTLLFSFGGMAIKLTGNFLSPFMTSLLRFVLGSLILLIIQFARHRKPRPAFSLLIVLGGIFKAVHYMAENYGVMAGYSYGTVLVLPSQTITVLIVSAILGQDRLTLRKLLGTLLTVIGVVAVSWNGAEASEFLSGQAKLLLILSLGGVGAGLFNVVQKKLVADMDPVSINYSMFLVGALVCLPFLPVGGPIMTGSPTPLSLLGMLELGMVTAVGFLLQALAMKRVSALIATIIQSSMAILTIFWSAVLFHEPVTGWVIGGTAVFFAGILIVNLRKEKKA
ncbi:MAG: DMT family transporter [Lachnospira sp.]|nr:DMT family transporter [Lachnospira sp.]